jgi:hypothetical protein
VTGGWGKVLLDPLNSYMTTTMANLDTLGSLITASFTVANDDWRARFYKAATPPAEPLLRTPSKRWLALRASRGPIRRSFTRCSTKPIRCRRPMGGAARRSRRISSTFPMISPSRCVSRAAGDYANGRFMFDAEGNLWSGMNWMPGSQSGVNKSTGGGVAKFSPNGVALSPPIFGFTGMGIDGVGWGTAVTKDRVWISSFNGKILVMDFNGKPVASESDFPFKEKFLGLMGIGVAPNGDVWIADGSDNQLLYFPADESRTARS